MSPATDQYSFAILVYQMITGKLPFEAESPYALIWKHLNERPVPLHERRPSVPQTVSEVIERALAKKPEDRFPSLMAFADAFRSGIQGIDQPATGFLLALPPEAPSRHIFVSYSRVDVDTMRHIRACLEADHLVPWTDTELEPGTPVWEATIAEAIEKAAAVIALLSPDAKKSIWVARELNYAEELGVKIIPVLVNGDSATAVPFRLVSTQRIDARTDFDAAMRQLVDVLRKHLKS